MLCLDLLNLKNKNIKNHDCQFRKIDIMYFVLFAKKKQIHEKLNEYIYMKNSIVHLLIHQKMFCSLSMYKKSKIQNSNKLQ